MIEEIKSYVVTIDDPVPELMRADIASAAGVYFIFSAVRKETADKKIVYSLRELLYIGRSNDVNQRINGQHHKHNEILKKCEGGLIPVYYYGQVSAEDGSACLEGDYVRVESALIFDKNPVLNETADKEFHHPMTFVSLVRSADTVNKNPETGVPNDLPLAFGGKIIMAI